MVLSAFERAAPPASRISSGTMAHGGVAVARGKRQALVDRTDQVQEARAHRQPGELRPSVDVDERPSLAGLVDVGMVERRGRLGLQDPRVERRQRGLAVERMAEQLGGLARPVDHPVDVQGRRHVGLHLGDAARHRERHGVARGLRAEPQGRRRPARSACACRSSPRSSSRWPGPARRCPRPTPRTARRDSPAPPAAPRAARSRRQRRRSAGWVTRLPSSIGGSRCRSAVRPRRVQDLGHVGAGCGSRRR